MKKQSKLYDKTTASLVAMTLLAIGVSGFLLQLEVESSSGVFCRHECPNGGYVTCTGEYAAGDYKEKNDEGCICDGQKYSCNDKKLVKLDKKSKKEKKKQKSEKKDKSKKKGLNKKEKKEDKSKKKVRSKSFNPLNPLGLYGMQKLLKKQKDKSKKEIRNKEDRGEKSACGVKEKKKDKSKKRVRSKSFNPLNPLGLYRMQKLLKKQKDKSKKEIQNKENKNDDKY